MNASLVRGALLRAALSAFFLAAAPLAAFAQAYPSKPITLIVPFPAGSPTDVAARIAASILGDAFKQTVVVDYKTGASGAIASRHVASAPADGYTLLATSSSTHVTGPAVNKELPYDAARDFVAISPVSRSDIVVVANPKLKASSLQELIDYIRKNPGKVTYASSGEGTALHLSGALFAAAIKGNMVHVPYRGAAPAAVDLLGGQVDLMFDTVSNAAPNVRTGRLKAYAVLSSERASALPDVPSSTELGLSQLNVPTVWLGVMGPAALPKDIVDQVSKALQEGVKRPEIRARIDNAGMQPDAMDSEQFMRRNEQARKVFDDLVRESGLKVGG